MITLFQRSLVRIAMVCAVCCAVFGVVNGEIKGVVVNESDEPVEGIVVAALATADSTYIDGAVTDSIGAFAVPVRGDIQNVILRLEGIGYEPKALTVSAGENVRVALQSRELTLGEVSVEVPQLQFSKGRFMFYPGNLTEYATDGFNLLQYVPLLRTNRMEDQLAVLGKDKLQIFINGKEPVAGNYGTIKLLKVADPRRIKKIEIIMEPSIGRQQGGAIVNIVLAPQTGSVMTADVYGNVQNGRISSRQQVFYYGEYNRWQFSASFHAAENNEKNTRESLYEFLPADGTPESSQLTRTTTVSNDYFITASAGASLDLLHNNSVGFKVSYNRWHRKSDIGMLVDYMPGNRTDALTNYFREPATNMADISVNYDHTLDTIGSSFWATANLYLYNDEQQNTYSPGAGMKANRLPRKQRSVKMTAQWSTEIFDPLSWVLGTKGYHDWQHFNKYESLFETLEAPENRIDDFRYIQSQMDLYTSLSYYNDVTSFRIGLTGRWYHRDVNQRIHSVDHGFSRFYALPSASFDLTAGTNHYLALAYTMDLEHPYYYLVNPIEDWSRPTSYFSGNPDLKSVKKHTLSLTYLFYRHYVLGAIADFRSNVAQTVSLPEPGGIIHTTPLETGRSNQTQVYLSYNNSFFKYRLNLNARVNWIYRHYTPSAEYRQFANGWDNTSQWTFNLSGTLTLGRNRDWELEATLNSESPLHQPFYNSGWKNIVVLYAAKNFGEKYSLSLQVYNLLDSKPSTWNDTPTYRSHISKINDQRSIMLRLDISLGKSFSKRDIGTRGGMGGL